MSHHRAIIFRRESTQLSPLIDRSREIVGRNGRYNKIEKRWTLRTGQILEFGSCQYEEDKEHYQGDPHDLKEFDEITHFTESQYLYLSGWNRTSVKGQRCRTVCTGNPPTTADGMWVSKRWAAWLDPTHPNPAKPGELRWYIRIRDIDTEVEGPGMYRQVEGGPDDGLLVKLTDEECGLARSTDDPTVSEARSRTFIPAKLADNPYYANSNYRAMVDALPEPIRTIYKTGNHFYSLQDDHWQLIPTEWIRASMQRWREHRAACGGRLEPPKVKYKDEGGIERERLHPMSALGGDLARGGADRNVFARRFGRWFAPLVVVPGVETPRGQDAAKEIVALLADEPLINVDVISIGSSPFDHLEEWGIPNVYGINFAAGSDAVDRSGLFKMRNTRAEAFFRLMELLDPESGEDLMLPDDNELLQELAAIHWEPTINGVKIEEKDDIRERIGRSPDKADAVALATFLPPDWTWDFRQK